MSGKKHEHIVKSIMPGSIAEELGIEPGDKLLSIDGQEIEDIFDYQFYVEDEEIVLLIEKQDGEQWCRGSIDRSSPKLSIIDALFCRLI